MKIGLVDSGVGGLTTLSVLMNKVHARYYYYMDNTHMPYGDKSHEELELILQDILSYFETIGVDVIVIACNTLSSIVDKDIREQCKFPILTIAPCIDEALESGGRTLVIATTKTIMSEKFLCLIKGKHNVVAKCSKCLAKYIEDNDLDMAKNELSSLLAGENVKNVVLGCTHYVHMKDYLESRGYRAFEGNNIVQKSLLDVMDRMSIIENKSTEVYIHSSATMDVKRIVKYLKYPIMLY